MRAAGIRAVYFDENWTYPDELEERFQSLASKFAYCGPYLTHSDYLDVTPHTVDEYMG